MKIVASFLLLTFFAFAAPAFAQDASSGATSQSSIQFNQPADIRSNIRTTPSIAAPGLTSSAIEACITSASGGGSGMGWGAVFAFGMTDQGCEARLDAKIMAQLGDTPAAKERLCDRPKIRKAYADAGRPCLADISRAAPTPTVRTASAAPLVTTKRMKIADMAPGTRYYLNGQLHTKR